MRKRTRWIIGGAAAAVVVVGAGTGIAVAADDDGPDVPITGSALERASAVALDEAGGGRVTGTEAGDEEGAYEVEVALDGGRRVDVHLDEGFRVLSSEEDSQDGD